MNPPVEKSDPGRIRKRTAKPVVAIIDELFAKEIVVVENGRRHRRSAFEIIILQLCNKAMAGNTRALNVLTKYSDFAASRDPSGGMRAEWVDDETNPKEQGGKNG